jgi:broad specificity phosphatase PhoE
MQTTTFLSHTLPAPDAKRRRIYIMRHGAVSYFDEAGRNIANPDTVPLTNAGILQAQQAGAAFAQAGIYFDRIICSDLLRTHQTAHYVLKALSAAGLPTVEPEHRGALAELKGGKINDIPSAKVREAFLGAFEGVVQESTQFLGGESIGQLLNRVLPEIDAIRADSHWDVCLLVLHGGVNRAILSYLLTGQRLFLGNLAQTTACINAIDVGEAREDTVLRLMNYAPRDTLHTSTRKTTMEHLLDQFLRLKSLLNASQ